MWWDRQFSLWCLVSFCIRIHWWVLFSQFHTLLLKWSELFFVKVHSVGQLLGAVCANGFELFQDQRVKGLNMMRKYLSTRKNKFLCIFFNQMTRLEEDIQYMSDVRNDEWKDCKLLYSEARQTGYYLNEIVIIFKNSPLFENTRKLNPK